MMIFPDWWKEWIVIERNEQGMWKTGDYRSTSLKAGAPDNIKKEYEAWIAQEKEDIKNSIRA